MREIRRLLAHQNDWALFGQFRDRCAAFIDRYTPTAPKEAILDDLTRKWVCFPKLTGYFLAVDDVGTPVGHVCASILNEYGQNRLMVYQAETDAGWATFDAIWPLIQQWVSELNSESGVTAETAVKKVVLTTWHAPEAFVRYFGQHGLDAIKVRHVIEADIFESDFPATPEPSKFDALLERPKLL